MVPAEATIRQQRPDSPSDLSAIREVTTLAFGDEGAKVTQLVDALQASDAYSGLSFIAERERRVVGHTMLTRSWLDAPQRLVEVLVLSPLSVHPDHQGQGVGAALVARALDEARASGAPAVFLEGDPRYYEALGVRTASAEGFERPSARIPESAFQVVTLPAHEPWMTGRVVYSDRFWATDCVGLREGSA